MSISIVIPILNQLADIKGCLAQLKHVTSPDVEWIIIDNCSTDPVEKFIYDYLKPKKLKFIRNDTNLGCFKSIQQGYEAAETDIVAFFHSDIFIYEAGWDRRIRNLFNKIDKLGMVGFFGAQGTFENGGRLNSWTNMLEAEIHGTRLQKEYQPVSVFDAFAMICSKQMLDACGGIDQQYLYHHFQDREMSLASLNAGYKNIVANIPCHHVNGITANRPEYQRWISEKVGQEGGDLYCHDHNMELWNQKYKDKLPIYINDSFEFIEHLPAFPQVDFKKWR